MTSSCSNSEKPSVLVRVAPGIYIDPTQRTDAYPGQHWLLLDRKGYEQLGIAGFGENKWETMRRLWEAGLIRLSLISPKLALLDLDSWKAHLRRCEEDPWLWDREGPVLKAYRRTYA